MKILTKTALSFIFLILLTITGSQLEAKENTTGAVEEVHQTNDVKAPLVVKSTFHMHLQGNVFEDMCKILPFHPDTLHTCSYNTSSPLVIIIHGWTLNGIMEEWIYRMASALKTRLGHVNVLINDWRPLAFKPYPVAAKNSRQVGLDVATLLQWLEETTQLSMDKVHLIGYSLGAHVAGFAGSHFKKARKLGRITGLDPAGPHFEGVPAFDRLSPDDAKFVDAVHTFSKTGIGIRQSVGHADFYPNGGSFQPGCKITDVYENVYYFGLQGLPKTIKCAHQRSVHLFTDSLLNTDKEMTGFRCRTDAAFDKGLCLDCKKNRCNTLGYGIKKVHTKGTKGFYLKTGPQTPFKVYHYQVKVMLVNLIEPVRASLSISVTGTKGETTHQSVTLSQEYAENTTYSSLFVVDSELGELQALRLHWKEERSWWTSVTDFMSGSGSRQNTELSVARIRLKSGESQEKTWFCGQAGNITHLKPLEEQEFVRCLPDTFKRKTISGTSSLLLQTHKNMLEQESVNTSVKETRK